MSRLKRFTHSLLSGYMQLGVNVLFTLGTVRLALHYLSIDEYGLWGVTSTVALYIALLDFGLSAATSRILIDYKDDQQQGKYGGVIQTDALVGLCQAGVILAVGIGLAFVIGPFLHTIPDELQPKIFWLVIGQAVITAAMFATRIVTLILTANQRFDICNYSGSLGMIVNAGVMWWGFAHGIGVYSMLWGQAASVVCVVALNSIGCCKLKLFPQRGHWGRPTWERFHELFAFGLDYFLFALGNQFVNASQAVLLTRLIGLPAAAIWTVYARAYLLLTQFIVRIFDFSSSALAEMIVQGDREKLLRRFRQITVLSVNLAVAAGALFAIGNTPFAIIWTAGKTFETPWLPWNDLLLAIMLVIIVTVRVHTGLVGQTKAFRFLRYIYFLEGITFISLTVLLHRFGGITVMLTASVVCSLCFTFPYGLYRTMKYFSLSWRDLALWHKDTLVLAATVAPAGVLVWWFTRNLPPLPRLVLGWTVLGIWTSLMFLHYGLKGSLRAEAARRLPAWARPILARVGIAKSED